MKLSEALAADVPLIIGERYMDASPIAYAWELRKGGLAWVNGGHQMSPSAEAHVVKGTIEGEGPWTLTASDGRLRLQIFAVAEHVRERGDRTAVMNYLGFWYQDLRKADLLL